VVTPPAHTAEKNYGMTTTKIFIKSNRVLSSLSARITKFFNKR